MTTLCFVRSSLALLAGALLLSDVAAAQVRAATEPTDCFAQPRAQSAARDTSQPDIILLASVSARELRFHSQPRVTVRLCGGLDSVRVVERRNLPERVVPGVTYRDVYVAVEILGHLYAECLRDAIAGADARARVCPTAADTARPAPRRPQ